MMADREADIKDALLAALAAISVGSGYYTDAGFRVFVGEEYKLQPPATPCLLVAFGERDDSFEGEVPPCIGEENHFLPVTVTGIVDDNERGERSSELKKDILKALKADRYLGNLTEGFEGGVKSSSSVAPAVRVDAQTGEQIETGGFIGSAEVSTTIFYVTAVGEE